MHQETLRSDLHKRPMDPTILAALMPRSSRIGSTMWSRGVVRKPQQSRDPTHSDVTDSFSTLLPARAAAASWTLVSVALRLTTMEPSEEPADTMAALARERIEIREKCIFKMVEGSDKWTDNYWSFRKNFEWVECELMPCSRRDLPVL